jgi:hypothetical protein
MRLGLLGRRASGYKFQANQLRLLLAYTLMYDLSAPSALRGIELERACIRTKLLKIGAASVQHAPGARTMSHRPLRQVFLPAARTRAS